MPYESDTVYVKIPVQAAEKVESIITAAVAKVPGAKPEVPRPYRAILFEAVRQILRESLMPSEHRPLTTAVATRLAKQSGDARVNGRITKTKTPRARKVSKTSEFEQGMSKKAAEAFRIEGAEQRAKRIVQDYALCILPQKINMDKAYANIREWLVRPLADATDATVEQVQANPHMHRWLDDQPEWTRLFQAHDEGIDCYRNDWLSSH
jgi:plasmid stability protein